MRNRTPDQVDPGSPDTQPPADPGQPIQPGR
jgi:hypothetical protein